MKTHLKVLLFSALMTLSGNFYAQVCQASWFVQSGAVTGEKLFVDNSYNVSSITLLTPGATPTSSIFLPGDTASVIFPSSGIHPVTYIVSNASTGCSDTINTSVEVCLIDPPVISFSSNPGEFTVTDPSLDDPSETGAIYFNGINSTNYTVTGNQYLNYSSNSTVMVTNSNGPHAFWYHTDNGAGNCYDSILVSFEMNSVVNCQANLSASSMTWLSPGTFYLLDQSLNNSVGVFNCPGATPSTVVFEPWNGVISDTIEFPANGSSYPYTYVTYDSISGCTDSISGVITVVEYPCTTQAGLIVTEGTNVGEFTITDNSANAATGTFYSTNSGGTVTLSPGGTSAIDYASNGWHYYTYIVEDSTGGCQDTITGSLYVSGVNCGAFAGLIMTPTGTPGEYVLTDNSTAGSTSYFNPGNGPGVQVLPSTSVTYNYTTNGTFNYTYYVNDSTTLCTDSVQGTVVVSGVIPPANCSASFSLMQDSLNMSQYYCWNNAVNSTGGTSGLSYLWDFGDGATSTQAYPTHTYSTLGTFTLCLTITEAINGCTSTFCDTIVVTVKASGTTINVLPSGASIGIDEGVLVSNLSLFPNPSDGIFKLQLESKVHTTMEVQIVSSTGQVVYTSIETIDEGSNEFKMDQSHISEGLYLVKLKDVRSGVFETIRFVKK
ncbi:MAG: PKD domain-containing protein [Flavobacteriales bacterium]|nr:PKD domain-containing protein [Flavobacteriales bacterium]